MKIYYPIPDSDNFDTLDFVNHGDWRILQTLRGESQSQNWKGLDVRINSINHPADFLSLSGYQLVCSQKAWGILKTLIDKDVEALPLNCSTSHYFILNVLNLLDAEKCLDLSRSVVKRYTSGRIMNVKSYVFHQEMVVNENVFQLIPTWTILVSETFKELVEQNSLEGLIFRQVGE